MPSHTSPHTSQHLVLANKHTTYDGMPPQKIKQGRNDTILFYQLSSLQLEIFQIPNTVVPYMSLIYSQNDYSTSKHNVK